MRFSNVPKLSFARKPSTDIVKTDGKTIKSEVMRAAHIVQADDFLSHLPADGQSFHGLMTGRYDLMHVIVAALKRLGPAESIRIATLSYNGKNLRELIGIMEADHPPCLSVLCSSFFRDHNKELWEESLHEFRERGQRIAATRSHAKIVTFAFSSGRKLVFESSANLRNNGNIEHMTIIANGDLHDYHSGWIDDLITKHEGEDKANGEGG